MTMTPRRPIEGPAAWRGRDPTASCRWRRAFTRETCPLPTLSAELADIRRELEDGAGLVMLDGLPVARYSEDELRSIFFGLGVDLGTPVSQSAAQELLYDIRRSCWGEEDAHLSQAYALRVFGVCDGHFTSHCSRTYIEAAQRMPDVPRMTPDQCAALDLLHEVAEALCIEMIFAPGDIQLLNNHVTYHARSAYKDDPASGRDRLLEVAVDAQQPAAAAGPRGALGQHRTWRVRGGIGRPTG